MGNGKRSWTRIPNYPTIFTKKVKKDCKFSVIIPMPTFSTIVTVTATMMTKNILTAAAVVLIARELSMPYQPCQSLASHDCLKTNESYGSTLECVFDSIKSCIMPTLISIKHTFYAILFATIPS